jgi:hypothetical protein
LQHFIIETPHSASQHIPQDVLYVELKVDECKAMPRMAYPAAVQLLTVKEPTASIDTKSLTYAAYTQGLGSRGIELTQCRVWYRSCSIEARSTNQNR